jgi:hypothetical protein
MKIEFIKETKSVGDIRIRYYTNIDNVYVDGSLELTEIAGRNTFENIVNRVGRKNLEILESINI